MKKLIFLFTLLVSMAGIVQADIKRSCDGIYWLVRLDADRKSTGVAGGLKAEGSCGKTVPIRCYRRARAKVMDCLTRHWKNKDKNYRPYECTNSAKVFDYDVINLKEEMIKEACRTLGHQQATFALQAESFSHAKKKECKVKKLLQNSLTIDCKTKKMWINE